MKKTKHEAAVQEVISALLSTERFTRAERDRLAYLLQGKSPPEPTLKKKRPAHRPQKSVTPYNNAAIYDLVFGFLANHEQLTALKAGDTSSIGNENAAMMIASLKSRSAFRLARAIRMTAEWFASRGIRTATKSKIENVVRRDLPQYASDIGFTPSNIKTASQWRKFKAFDEARKNH